MFAVLFFLVVWAALYLFYWKEVTDYEKQTLDPYVRTFLLSCIGAFFTTAIFGVIAMALGALSNAQA